MSSAGGRTCPKAAIRSAAWALAAALVLAMAAPVSAQTAKDDSVMNRPRPELDPLGLPLDRVLSAVGLVDEQAVRDRSSALASFVVLPRIEAGARFQSNLFRTENNAVSDRIWEIAPALDVASDWTNHSLRVSAGADIGRHRTSTEEDYEDLHLTVSGRLDMRDDIRGEASIAVERLHLQRGDPDDPGPAGGAIIYRRGNIRLGGAYRGDVRIRPEFEATVYDYDDSGALDQDERDRVENEATLRVGYELSPGSEVYIEPSYNWRVYDQDRDNSGFLQGSEGGRMLLGLAWDLTGVTYVELGAGYIVQRFDEPSFDTVSGFGFNGRMIWNPDELVTLTATADRRVLETVLADVSGILASTIGGRADYEIHGDVLASLGLEYTNYDYGGSGRSDDVLRADFEAKYLINRNWFTSLKVSHDRRSSNEAGEDYSDSGLSLRLGSRL